MIRRIEGELVAVSEGAIEIRCGDVTYGLLISAADQQRLEGLAGSRVELHVLHYLESQGQGSSFVPRLIAFPTPQARAFFELLTTVKGLGARKTLRAMRLPYTRIARAIAGKDADLLTTLPEIGRRTAETIVAELSGKVDRFIDDGDGQEPGAAGGAAPPGVVRDAMAAMAQLGEPKITARRLIERAFLDDPRIETADELVAAAYRARGDTTD